METPLPIRPPDDPEAIRPPMVTVRYWASARAAAGRAEEQVSAGTVAAALAQARLAHLEEPRFARVLDISSFLLGDRPVATHDLASVAVGEGDVIEVLPPFAGG